MAENLNLKPRMINLLPRGGNNFGTQILNWSLTVGRLLVIITETLALSVFLFRFTVDMQIIDLHDKIKNASQIVSNFKSGEDTYRDLHQRLSYAKTYNATKNKSLKIMKDVLAMGDGKVTFRTLIVNTDTVEIQVQAPSPETLSAFTDSLNRDPDLVGVSVNRVENRTTSGIVTVGISADVFGATIVRKKPRIQ